MKLGVVLVNATFLFLISTPLVMAQDMPQEQAATAETSEAVNVGNKICPVLNEKIDEKLKVTYEYQGKTYNFCCRACLEEFKKDPERYIKKIEKELQARSNEEEKEENRMMPDSDMPMDMPEGYHH